MKSEVKKTKQPKHEWLLKFTTGSNIGAEVALKNNHSYVVGTADDCDIILHDKGLEPHHAAITVKNNQLLAEPLDGVVGLNQIRIHRKTRVNEFASLAFQYTCCLIGPSRGAWPAVVNPAFIKTETLPDKKENWLTKTSDKIKTKASKIVIAILLALIAVTAVDFSYRMYDQYHQQIVDSQSQALEDAFVRNYKLLNIRLLRGNFKELFLVSNYTEKKFYLTGYVKTKKRMAEVIEIISKEAFFETINQALIIEDILAVMSETLAFLGYNMVKPEYDGDGKFAITGFVPKYDDVLVAERNIFQDIIGIKALSVRVFSQKIEELTTSIHFGKNPYIADKQGNRYFEGSIIEPGVRLEKITRTELVFDYNGKTIAYQVKQLTVQKSK